MSFSGSPMGIGEFITGYMGQQSTASTAKDAQNLQQGMYNQTRADMMPLIQAGQGATNQLAGLMQPGGQLYNTGQYSVANYQQDPYYNWLQQQGAKSIQAKGAAMGNIGSGNMGTALVDYSQNLAGAGYSDWYNRQMQNDTTLYNRLMGLISPAQTATAQVGSAGGAMAANVGANNIYSNQLGLQQMNQGLAAMGRSSGQAGNAIMQGINAYQKNNFDQDYANQLQYNNMYGAELYGNQGFSDMDFSGGFVGGGY